MGRLRPQPRATQATLQRLDAGECVTRWTARGTAVLRELLALALVSCCVSCSEAVPLDRGLTPQNPIRLGQESSYDYLRRLVGPCGNPIDWEPVESHRLRGSQVLEEFRISGPDFDEVFSLFLMNELGREPRPPPPLQLLPVRQGSFPLAEVPVSESCECSYRVPEGRSISSFGECRLQHYVDRCQPGDSCLLRCWANGWGKDVSGGCWHVCFSNEVLEYPKTPEGAERCSDAAESL